MFSKRYYNFANYFKGVIMQETQNNLAQVKSDILAELKMRVEDRILEPNNYEVLCKLINKADSISEAQAIAALGTTYKKTGFHFDMRLENLSNDIHFLAKDKALSFENDKNAITHKLIIGDNYPALLNLLITYREKIKVIYIDPPYGKDDLGEFAKTNYENAITRDNLLSMLKPRLEIAKMLLKDDGVIFCSIDDRNQAYVKCLFDDIFGEGNFVANLIWQKKKGGSQDSQYFAKEHEYILCYTKKEWEINDDKQAHDEADFNKIINGKKAKIMKLEKWGSNALRENAPSLFYPIKDPNGNDVYPVAPNGKEGNWRKKPENLDKEHIFWQENSKGRLTPYEVIYFDEMQDKDRITKTRTMFTEYGTTTDATKEILSIFGGDKVFDTPKPINLIKRLLEISTTTNLTQNIDCHEFANTNSRNDSECDIILDFFAGSGTTAHAVMELNRADNGNRECILVTNNEITELNPNGIAVDVTAKRLKRIMSGECYDGSKNFKWREKNEPYKDNLEVFRIEKVSKYAQESNKSVLEVIDESAYGLVKFDSIHEKAKWIAKNFDITLKELENDKAYKMRQKGE